jgi:hypothetical protein
VGTGRSDALLPPLRASSGATHETCCSAPAHARWRAWHQSRKTIDPVSAGIRCALDGRAWTSTYGDTLTRVCPSARQAIFSGGPTNTAGDWSSCAIGRRFAENCWPARLASCSPPSCHVVYPHQRPNLHQASRMHRSATAPPRSSPAESTRYGYVTRYLTPRANST